MTRESRKNKVEQLFTICKKCKFFFNKEPGSARRHIWYNHICHAIEREKGKDPYDGKEKYIAINDLGRKYFTNEPYRYCRDVNPNGHCPYYCRDKRLKILRRV